MPEPCRPRRLISVLPASTCLSPQELIVVGNVPGNKMETIQSWTVQWLLTLNDSDDELQIRTSMTFGSAETRNTGSAGDATPFPDRISSFNSEDSANRRPCFLIVSRNVSNAGYPTMVTPGLGIDFLISIEIDGVLLLQRCSCPISMISGQGQYCKTARSKTTLTLPQTLSLGLGLGLGLGYRVLLSGYGHG